MGQEDCYKFEASLDYKRVIPNQEEKEKEEEEKGEEEEEEEEEEKKKRRRRTGRSQWPGTGHCLIT